MKIITCASYYGTGSSAVTDLLSEYSSIRSLGRYEYRFAWDPDGVSDLEFNIVQNNNRNCTSYSNIFIICLCVYTLLDALSGPLWMLAEAEGNIKNIR